MRSRLLNLLALLSLLLCLAAVVVWVRSYWAQDVLRARPRAGGGLVVHVFWQRGSIACTRTFRSAGDEMPADRRVLVRSTPLDQRRPDLYAYWGSRTPRFHRWGFSLSRPDPQRGALGGVLVPLWLPVLLFAPLPAARISGYVMRARRRRLGHCRFCGYDLRATPGRCPECGSGREGA